MGMHGANVNATTRSCTCGFVCAFVLHHFSQNKHAVTKFYVKTDSGAGEPKDLGTTYYHINDLSRISFATIHV